MGSWIHIPRRGVFSAKKFGPCEKAMIVLILLPKTLLKLGRNSYTNNKNQYRKVSWPQCLSFSWGSMESRLPDYQPTRLPGYQTPPSLQFQQNVPFSYECCSKTSLPEPCAGAFLASNSGKMCLNHRSVCQKQAYRNPALESDSGKMSSFSYEC